MSERIVHLIPNLQTKKYEQKAVGIYARVSTAHSAQLHSVSLQLSVLIQRVYHNPELAIGGHLCRFCQR